MPADLVQLDNLADQDNLEEMVILELVETRHVQETTLLTAHAHPDTKCSDKLFFSKKFMIKSMIIQDNSVQSGAWAGEIVWCWLVRQ